MNIRTLLSTLLIASMTLLPSRSALADDGPSIEQETVFRPVRIGVCAGWNADCMAGGPRLEIAGRYVGANVSLTAGIAGSIKAYPFGAHHGESLSIRPYLYAGVGNFWGTAHAGGGVGADFHLFQSKRIMLQPSVSVHRRCEGQHGGTGSMAVCSLGAGASLSLMTAF